MEKITMDHGSGGKLSHKLIKEVVVKAFSNPSLNKLDDSAILNLSNLGGCTGRIAFTTDSYVVNPIFFPGGDIGMLAVNGTVNDLSMMGAIPLYLSASCIVEEGFPMPDFKKIIQSMKKASQQAGVYIVTGDLKVVEKGAADKMFVNTSGIGIVPKGVNLSAHNARRSDVIILSGSIADHGIAIINERNNLKLKGNLKTDSQPLNFLVKKMLGVSKNIHCLRDPTRGGLATTLNEIAESSGKGIEIDENRVPIKKKVSSSCEMLGFDPLYVANEGKLIAIVAEKDAKKVILAMKSTKQGRNAAIIGKVVQDKENKVILKTSIGGRRILDMMTGEQLPRIC